MLTDRSGLAARLEEGRNVVGRVPTCDVVVHSSYTDVSRCHAVIFVKNFRVVAITDLSSRGTYLPREAMPDRG